MIRLILDAVFLVLFLILSSPFLLIEWIIRKKHPEKTEWPTLVVIRWVVHVLQFFAGVDLTVIGEENVPTDEPVLYIGNHRSIFDIVISYGRCKRPTGYLAKSEFSKVPLFAQWIVVLGGGFIDRGDVRQALKTILYAIDQIKRGTSMAIYPEGTRSRTADECELLPFHEGSFKISTKTDCYIVPMTISGTSAIFEEHFPWVKKTKVVLEYGKPFRPSELSKEDQRHVGAYTQRIIQETLIKNKELL